MLIEKSYKRIKMVYRVFVLLLIIVMFTPSKLMAGGKIPYLLNINNPNLAIMIVDGFACIVCLDTAQLSLLHEITVKLKIHQGVRRLILTNWLQQTNVPSTQISNQLVPSYSSEKALKKNLSKKRKEGLLTLMQTTPLIVKWGERWIDSFDLFTGATYLSISHNRGIFHILGPYNGESLSSAYVALGTPKATAILDSYGLQQYLFDGGNLIPVLPTATAVATQAAAVVIGAGELNPLDLLVNMDPDNVIRALSPGGAGFPLPPGGNPDDFNPYLQQALMPNPYDNQGLGAVGLRTNTTGIGSWDFDMSDPDDEPPKGNLKDAFD